MFLFSNQCSWFAERKHNWLGPKHTYPVKGFSHKVEWRLLFSPLVSTNKNTTWKKYINQIVNRKENLHNHAKEGSYPKLGCNHVTETTHNKLIDTWLKNYLGSCSVVWTTPAESARKLFNRYVYSLYHYAPTTLATATLKKKALAIKKFFSKCLSIKRVAL